MGKGLNKSELTGLILLALLIAAITVLAVLMKDCGGEERVQPGYPAPAEVVQPASADGENCNYEKSSRSSGSKGSNGRARKSSGGRKSSAAGSKSSGKSSSKSSSSVSRVAPERPDPFLDTIPLDWDDWEEPVTPF